jgi:hypothetical protein
VSKFYELGFQVIHDKYNNTYRGCCPICREGKSWGSSQRCYYLPERNQIYCHNCGEGWRPFDWIQQVSGMEEEEISAEVEDNEYGIVDVLYLEEEKTKKKSSSLPEDSINLLDTIQLEYYKNNLIVKEAISYMKRRRLNTAINKPDAFYVSLKDYTHKNRLVIPFKDDEGKIIFYQSRKIFDYDEKGSYISKSGADKSIFGMDKINSDLNDVFLLEGPIDACFVKNGLGLAGINKGMSNMTPTQTKQLGALVLYNKIWCLDSQWLDETSREKTQHLIAQGETVFLWPEKFGKRYKDFNAMCVDKGIDQISPEFIKKHSFRGKEAVLKYKLMKV